MSRQALLIGAAPGDDTGDPARVGSNKINLNFAELYAFLGGDTLTQTAGSVLLGNGTGALSSFASTAGRLVIGNGSSGLTDDANLTWDATNKILTCGPTSPVLNQVGLFVHGALKVSGDGCQLLDGSANNMFRAVRTGCWVDGATATFFEVGNDADKVFFATLFGDVIPRLAFSANVSQFTTANFSVAPVPGGIFQVDDGTNVALRIVTASSIFVGGADPGGTDLFRINGALTINSATMIQTKTAFTNGAAAAVGTLNNAPAAGDPTKWIPINDNGTTRYIPTW